MTLQQELGEAIGATTEAVKDSNQNGNRDTRPHRSPQAEHHFAAENCRTKMMKPDFFQRTLYVFLGREMYSFSDASV